jgi:Tfp pilus assembly protein PilE
MIVVAIIGIMAAICIPSFVRLQCRAKQSEAKEAVKAMWVVEEVYHGEYDQYLTVTEMTSYGGLDHSTIQGRYYSYTVTGAPANFFLSAVDGVAPRETIYNLGVQDRWDITDDDPRPINTIDRCLN